MQVVSTVKEVRDIVAKWRKEGKTVGFVPRRWVTFMRDTAV